VWIGADETISTPMFRREFCVREEIRRARAYICGLGYYELRLNGQKVGDHVLDPNWTDFDEREMRDLNYPFDDRTTKRCLYVTYDVTELLQAGENAVGVWLGNGMHNQRVRDIEGKMWYGPARLLLQLEVEYADGSREVLVSDDDWRCASSPITFNNVFIGEIYDARLEQPGWDQPGFSADDWAPVCRAKVPAAVHSAQMSPSDKVQGTLAPVARLEPQSGVYVFDFGQNFAGWVRLRVQGAAGTAVTLRFTEEIHPDGTPFFDSTGGHGSDDAQIQRDVYILRGEGEECYEPRFVWHGFRYVEVSGYPGEPALAALEGRIVHSAVQPVGQFACSNLLLNQIQTLYRWTQLANYHGCVPSDCPHRERLGYTGDGQLTAEAAMLNFGAARLYTKWLRDIADAQNTATGFVPHTAPFYGGGGGPAWGSAYPIVAWQLYRYSVRALRGHAALGGIPGHAHRCGRHRDARGAGELVPG
jgi:alpha-L-rhamnosidase